MACPRCGKARPEAWPVGKDVLRYFRHLQRSTWEQIEGVTIPPSIEPLLADLVERYITYILERKLNSPDFLREVRKKPNGSSPD